MQMAHAGRSRPPTSRALSPTTEAAADPTASSGRTADSSMAGAGSGDSSCAVLPGPYGRSIVYPSILVVGGLLFFSFLGSVSLFDWDEINFAEIAREMLVTRDFLTPRIDFAPFWEKPPLFMWMQACSMTLFGVNEFAARFPNAVGGLVTLLVLYEIGRRVQDARLGALWSLVYAGSILPFFYFKSGIIDPWFNLFIFSGIFLAVLGMVDAAGKNWKLFASGMLVGLGILTKGPAALLIVCLTAAAWMAVARRRIPLSVRNALSFLGGLVITGGFWFAVQLAAGRFDLLREFFVYQLRLFSTKDAGHGGFPGYHVVVLMLGLFPASAFFLGGLKAASDESSLQRVWRQACIALMLTVVVLFEIVRTKIIHYSSLAYFPVTFLAALSLSRIIAGEQPFTRLSKGLLLVTGSVVGLGVVGLSAVGFYRERIVASGMIRDPFVAGSLGADVPWSGYEWSVALILLAAVAAFLMARNPTHRVAGLFGLSALFVFALMLVFTGRIEGHSQRAALDFYRSKREEDCHLRAVGFKSYATLFYGQKRPGQPMSSDEKWLASGAIDKPAYFVFKIKRKAEQLARYPELKILYEKNGFVFACRTPEDHVPRSSNRSQP